MYRTEDGIAKNSKQAIYGFAKASEQGIHMAQFFFRHDVRLWTRCRLGRTTSLLLVYKGKGIHMAQFFLGMMYNYGQGVDWDEQQLVEKSRRKWQHKNI